MKHSKIISTGSYLPELELRNEDFKQFPAHTHKMIYEKTGIKSRRRANENECTSDLAIRAALNCLEKAAIPAASINAVIIATSSPDSIQPQTAARVQTAIGATNAFAFDINAVCSGSVYGIHLADSLIKSGACENVLLVGAEVYSKILFKDDFSTYPYFGDGAGALLFTLADTPGVIRTILKTDGTGADTIQVMAGGTRLPYSKLENARDSYFQMNGRAVYEFATQAGSSVVHVLLNVTGIRKADVKYVIAHQANINILQEISMRLDIEMDKFHVSLDKYGNTAAASIPISFDEIFAKLEKGDHVIAVAFGGGLSWGASLIAI